MAEVPYIGTITSKEEYAFSNKEFSTPECGDITQIKDKILGYNTGRAFQEYISLWRSQLCC